MKSTVSQLLDYHKFSLSVLPKTMSLHHVYAIAA